MKNTLKIALAGFGYLLVFILGATSGLIHPACYAYIGTVLPLLSAFLYLYVSAHLRGFGAALLGVGFYRLFSLVSVRKIVEYHFYNNKN